MIKRFVFALLLFGYCLLLPSFVGQMVARPVEVKLGYLPHPRALRLLCGEFSPLVAELSVIKVLFYYGTLIDKWQQNIIIQPEHQNMFRALMTASELDPYNQDTYYFAQAAFTWDLGRIKEVNWLLERGMEYRTWDHWLPFYIGFNEAYFLKNYAAAAKFMKISAELSGDLLRTNLASRYLYESNRTGVALAFLDTMIAKEKNPVVKKTYQIRKEALQAVETIELAISAYQKANGSAPINLLELVRNGFLEGIPHDPYGGKFYLDQDNRVRSSSHFARLNDSGDDEDKHDSDSD